MFFTPYDFLILPAILLAMYAQFKVRSSFNKYSRVPIRSGMTGAQVARIILDRNRLQDVPVELSHGTLSDHYDPKARVVRLSPEVYHGQSVAAVGVAAHECGHAIQHDTEYLPLNLRHAIFPVANIGSMLAFPLILIGIFLQASNLLLFGIIFFTGAVLFQLITLPVELNASNRALALLGDNGFITREEAGPTRKVLMAAALTYIAATLVSVMELLKYILIYTSSQDE